MTRIDLRQSSGIPLFYENNSLELLNDNFLSVKEFPIGMVKSQLLNEDVNCPDIFYKTHVIPLSDNEIYSKLSISVVVLMPNLAGVEYVKTRATSYNTNRIIEVLYGGGTIVFQNFDDIYNGDIKYATIKKLSKIIIPKNYQVSVVNTKLTPLIYLDISLKDSLVEDSLDVMKGMSYYVIRKNAKQEIVRNPEYKMASVPKKVNYEKVITKFGITSKTPILKQLVKNNSRFDWLFNNDIITL